MWGWRGHTSVSHLVWTGFVVWPSSYDKELAGATGHRRRADGLFHGSHLCPAVGEGIITLHTAQAALTIVATHSVHLRTDTQTNKDQRTSGTRYLETFGIHHNLNIKICVTHLCLHIFQSSSLRQHLKNSFIRCRRWMPFLQKQAQLCLSSLLSNL